MSKESIIKKLHDEKAANTEEIRQLENRNKILMNRKRDIERRERTHRLIEKGAVAESVFPHTSTMSGEEFKSFLLRFEHMDKPP